MREWISEPCYSYIYDLYTSAQIVRKDSTRSTTTSGNIPDRFIKNFHKSTYFMCICHIHHDTWTLFLSLALALANFIRLLFFFLLHSINELMRAQRDRQIKYQLKNKNDTCTMRNISCVFDVSFVFEERK